MLVPLPCGGTPQQRGHDHPEAGAHRAEHLPAEHGDPFAFGHGDP